MSRDDKFILIVLAMFFSFVLLALLIAGLFGWS